MAGLGACSLAGAIPPQVDVASVQLVGAGLLEQRLNVALCIYNPNASELAFRSVDVGIDVAGAPLADGTSATSVRLPPGQAVLVPFTVSATTQNLGSQLATTLSTGAVPYRVHGVVHLATLGIPIPFSRNGQLELLSVVGQAMLADSSTSNSLGCRPGP
jgi:LEA14-like dessication related protein